MFLYVLICFDMFCYVLICFDMLGGLRGSGGSMKSTRSRKEIDDIAFGIHGIPSTPRYYSLYLVLVINKDMRIMLILCLDMIKDIRPILWMVQTKVSLLNPLIHLHHTFNRHFPPQPPLDTPPPQPLGMQPTQHSLPHYLELMYRPVHQNLCTMNVSSLRQK